VLEAVRHAIRAADWQLVGRLMVTAAAGRAVSAERQAFAALLAEIPPGELSTTAELRACGAMHRYLIRDYAGFAHHAAHARALLAQRSAEERRPIEIFLLAADTVLARIAGDAPALRAAANDLLERLSSASKAGRAAAQWEAPALSNLGVGLLWSAQADNEAEQHLRAAIGVATEARADLALAHSLGHIGMLEVGRGNLRAAHALAAEGAEIARRRGWTELAQTIACHLTLAEVAFERHDLAEAQVMLEAGLAAHRNDPDPLAYLALRSVEARLLLTQGQVSRAEAVMADGRAASTDHDIPPLLRQMLALVEAEANLASGHPGPAFDHLRAWTNVTGGRADTLRVCGARTKLASAQFADAQAIASTATAASLNRTVVVEGWLVMALAADEHRDDHRAVFSMDRALEIAEPEEVRRPFFSFESTRVRALLEHRKRLGADDQFASDLLAILETRDHPVVAKPLDAPLTDREHIVLRHMAALQTNDEIAAELFISINTVKSHVRAVFRKLGVPNRREAVHRARGLGLI